MKKVLLLLSIVFLLACEREDQCPVGVEIRDANGNVIDCFEAPEIPTIPGQ